jgi:hypothetical protein
MRRPFLWHLLIAATLFFGLACGTPVTVVTPPTASTLQTGEGVVILSMTTNTARAGQFGSINVQRTATPGQPAHDYVLLQVSAGLSRDTSIFVGSLPPGDYTFTRLNSGQQFVSLGEKGRALLGHFQVGADETVDLGRLVLTGINTGVLVGRSVMAADNGDLLRATAPDQVPLLDRKRGQGWVEPRSKVDQVEAYARANPVGADALTELPGGFVAACSRLGSLLIRQPGGRWAVLSTGRLSSLLSLVPAEDTGSRLVAVGEFKTLVRVDQNWKVAALDPGNLPAGNLFFIDGNAQAGWVVGHQAGQQLTFFQSPRLEAGDWKVIRQEAFKNSIWSGQNRMWTWRTPTGFAYATSFGGIHTYLREKGEWARVAVPGDANITGVAIQEQWGLLTSPGGGFGGIFASVYTSGDQGRTWVEMNSPFATKGKAPCVLGGGTILQQALVGKSELHLSQDGGRTWTLVSEKIANHEQLIATPTQGIFAVNDGGASFGFASISCSQDQGRTWRREISNFNRALYEREQQEKGTK